MVIFSHSPTTPQAVAVDGVIFLKIEWMQSGSDPGFSPTVFLVEQPPESSLRTHFHRHNQFQLFVRGGGSVGPHRLDALTVHYSGAYSGYGPLLAGPQGLAYFTLRSVFEVGSLTMAQHAGQMKRGPKRQLHSKPVPLADAGSLADVPTPQVEDLIALQDDGVCARRFTLGANQQLFGPDPAGFAGQFYVVTAGLMHAGDRTLHLWESVYVSADEKPFEIVAGKQGLQVVCLQLPPMAPEYLVA